MNEQFTLLLYLIGILFIIPLSLEDGLTWKEVSIVKTNKTDLTQFAGKDLCEGNQLACLDTFKEYIEKHWFLEEAAFRAECDKDDSLGGIVVCWLRRKYSDGFPRYRMLTRYQMQFWTDKNGSHCRDNWPRGQ
uniref:Uncharacterized protein n=1 Tax=Cacopsylla melanoneura TaxID=428564 RepID=A0A8D8X2L4_9HEMI